MGIGFLVSIAILTACWQPDAKDVIDSDAIGGELRRLGASYDLGRQGELVRVDFFHRFAFGAAGKRLVNALSLLQGLEGLDMAYTDLVDEQFFCVRGFRNLKDVSLSYTQIGDRGIAFLSQSLALESLSLESTNVGAMGLLHIHSRKLRRLVLSGPQVDDRAVARIAKFRHLKQLILNGDHITDEGILPLRRLGELQILFIRGKNISSESLDRLQGALPNCLVIESVGLNEVPSASDP